MGTRPEEALATSPPAPYFLPHYKWPGYHQYESVQPEPQPEIPPSLMFDTKTAAPLFTNAVLPWRPSYLGRLVLAPFLVLFVLVIAAIEVLLAVSNNNNGIASGNAGQHYLWTYGPTAFLTLVAVVWGRIEYQAKQVAPWIRLSQHPVDPSRTLLLDYVSAFQLFAVFKSLRNRDFMVSTTSAVSIVIKILIVISTGLITLSWTGVTQNSYPMVILDSFVDSDARLSNTGNLAFYVMQGLMGRNLTYPDGMSEDYAFQSVQTNLPDTAQTQVTVYGFTNSLDCQPADVTMTGANPPDPHYSDATMNLTVTSPGCNLQALRIEAPQWSGYGNTSSTFFARFAETQCDGTTDDAGKMVLVMFGNLSYSYDYSRNTTDYTGNPTHPIVGVLHKSTQMLCTPTYAISRVDVVRNGTQTQSVMPSQDTSNSTLDSVSAWSIMAAHYAAYDNGLIDTGFFYGASVNVSMVPVDVDQYMEIGLPSQLAPETQATDLFDATLLQQVATGYYRKFAAIIAKQSLMEPASVQTTGFAIVNENRLVVRSWAAQWMVSLAAACVILTLIALFLVPRQGILPCSPSTIPGKASLLFHSHDLLARLAYSGAADEKSLGGFLQTSTFQSGVLHDPASGQAQFAILTTHSNANDGGRGFPQIKSKHPHPGILHPASRLALCLVLVALIIALELMLRKSTNEEGLGDVGNDTYIHYTWTTIPALVFGLLTMIFSSMDFRVRSLAPYTTIKQTATTDIFMTLDFLDMSVPRAIYKEIKLVNIGAFATTSTLLVASLFTIFSGSLFQALSIPTTSSMTLRANQSFDLQPYGNSDADSIASLILESNYSYPRFTYSNLAFPQFVPTTLPPTNSSFNTSTISINVVVPAVRGKMDCRVYDSTKIRTNLTLNYTIEDIYTNPLGVYIEGEECDLFPQYEDYKYNNILTTYSNATYFALGSETGNVSDVQGCSQLLYTWGQINYAANPIVQHIASMGCNVTFEAVDVDTTFIGTDLNIDTQNPPQPREDTVRNSTIQGDNPRFFENAQSLVYADLAAINTDPQLLDTFFAMLVTSPWAVPISDLGNASAINAVADAIQFQHGIIQAQTLAQQLVPANSSNATIANPTPIDNDAQPIYNATVTAASGRVRVVQDAASTRILESLLGVALLLLVVGWVFMRETDVLPRSPNTIASVAALVAGGNLPELLPPDAEWRSPAEIAWALGPRTRFWMGWGLMPDMDGKMMGGENEGGESRFGIFAVREEQQTAYHGVQNAGEYGPGTALMGGQDGLNGSMDGLVPR